MASRLACDLTCTPRTPQENVWSVKDLVGSHKEDGLSRGVPVAPVALRA